MSTLVLHKWFQGLILGLLLILIVAFSFSNARWRQQIRNFTFDNYNIAKPRVDSGRIVIVDIDEASLKTYGQMPWPRSLMAQLVDKLHEMGAAVITFDIVFPEEDRLSPHSLANILPDENLSNALKALPDNDTAFGEAIKRAGNVVTGFSFTHEKTDATPRQIGLFRGKSIENYVPNLQGASTNLKVISKHAAGNGSFFVSTDTDGIIRRVPMLIAHKKPDSEIISTYPSLSLETIRVFDGERGGHAVLADSSYASLDQERFGLEGIKIGNDKRFIPTNPKGEFLVYFAPSNPDWYLSAKNVLDSTASIEDIKDKVILIGTSAVGLKDIRSTPLNSFVPGAEVHLNIIDQILQGNFLRRSVEAEGLEAFAVLLAGLFIIVFTPYAGALSLAVFVTGLIFSFVYAGWWAYSAHGMLIDIAYPVLSILVLFSFSTIATYLRSERERQHVRQAFGQYISPDFMEELTKNPDKLKLGGEIRDLTVVFTDIRQFTTISEALAPQELIQLMNDFLTPMSDLVMKNRGTIDKYMGDAMMAFWNAPLDDPQHARNACKAALGMQKALDPINEDLRKNAKSSGNKPITLRAGIGINTGPCAVGNMGSKQRFDYSALGDAVNLASRFEGQTKLYGVGILIGEETYRHVPDLAALEVDLITVKGKTEPVHVYALIGDETYAKTSEYQGWKTLHTEMLSAYRAQDFSKAVQIAHQCMHKAHSIMQGVYELYHTRCTDMLENPPPANWNGVFEAKNK